MDVKGAALRNWKVLLIIVLRIAMAQAKLAHLVTAPDEKFC